MYARGCLAAVASIALLGGFLLGREGSPPAASAQVLSGAPAGARPRPVQGFASAASRFLMPRTLDADGLEELFNRVAREGGVAHLPGGIYRINRTIRVDGLGPFRIEGEGHGDLFNPDGTGWKSQPTRLLWTGPAGGTLLSLDYSVGQVFSNLQFDGNNKAGRLVQWRFKPGWGPGNQRFERVVFRGAEVAIQVGEDAMDHNCGDLVFDECSFVFLGTAFRAVNHQAVNHYFRTLSAHHVNTVFDFQRGGNLNVDGWTAGTFDLLIKVGVGGPNAGMYRFAGGRPEMNGRTKRYARLAEVVPEHSADVIFDCTQESGGPFDDKLPRNDNEPAFRVGPGGNVTLRNHLHQRPAIELVNGGGRFRCENGRWMVPLPDPAAVARVSTAAPTSDPGARPVPENFDTPPTVEIVNPHSLKGRRIGM
jgi:hypothetical protein